MLYHANKPHDLPMRSLQHEAAGMLGKKRAGQSPFTCLVPLAPPRDNRKTEPRGAFKAPSLRDSPSSPARSLQKKGKKVEENWGAPIDKDGHLRVSPATHQ